MDHPQSNSHWLQRLKDESWEAELLVSAIAIFGSFQLFALIDWLTERSIDLLNPNQYTVAYFIVFLALLGVSILVAMFIIHFLLRSYWIGLIGLNSVFPDYSLEDSAYSKIYTEKMLAILPKLSDTIHVVDELCSVIFSAAFCGLLVYAYTIVPVSAYLAFYNTFLNTLPQWLLLAPAVIVGLVLIVSSLLSTIANNQRLRNSQPFQTAHFQITKLSSLIFFGPVYKIVLQVTMIFASNFKKKKHISYLVVSFGCVGVVLAVFKISYSNIEYLIDKSRFLQPASAKASLYRENNLTSSFIVNPEIPSELISDSILPLFIPVFNHEKRIHEQVCGAKDKPDDALPKPEKRRIRQVQLLECASQYHRITRNGIEVQPDFIFAQHPHTGQKGVLTYIDTDPLAKGTVNIQVEKHLNESLHYKWSIPFYFAPR